MKHTTKSITFRPDPVASAYVAKFKRERPGVPVNRLMNEIVRMAELSESPERAEEAGKEAP